jgi:hypothetical protein
MRSRTKPGCDAQPLHIRRAIVLPWPLDDQLWRLKVRTNREQPKYLAISGVHPWVETRRCKYPPRRRCEPKDDGPD